MMLWESYGLCRTFCVENFVLDYGKHAQSSMLWFLAVAFFRKASDDSQRVSAQLVLVADNPVIPVPHSTIHLQDL